MIRTKKIKVWLIVTQAIIVIGMGHGILTLGILEPMGLWALSKKLPPTQDDGISGLYLRLVALTSLLGQVAVITSIFVKSRRQESFIYPLGILLLWFALLAYGYGIRNDSYSYLAVITCLPFFYCTVRTLFGRDLDKIWQRILSKS